MDYYKQALKASKKLQGKIEISSKIKIKTKKDLSIAYTPGVAEVSRVIAKSKNKAYEYTIKGNTIAVISDGSAVLGLGNIGAEAALPVMEGKALLFKEFGGVNAMPIVLNTQNTKEIIEIIKAISPTFAGINLEDISAPRCFEIEETLKNELNIPVFHDDQHGTAIVVLAGLINALKITKKNKEEIKVIVNGVGAAGTAIARLLKLFGIKKIVAVDSKGVINKHRKNLNKEKTKLLKFLQYNEEAETLEEVLYKADVFIGVSIADILTSKMIQIMAQDPIIFAMANPKPEIMPESAKKAGARIIATGRSDYPNQVNNVLAFPGIFKGVIQYDIKQITDEMKLKAAFALARLVKKPTEEKIIPNPFEKNIADTIARAISS